MLATGSIYGVSGACRQPYATVWARMMVFLLSMQGLGKPGVNTWGGASLAPPIDFTFKMFGYSDNGWDAFGIVAKETAKNSVTQKTYRLLLPECVMNREDRVDRRRLLRAVPRTATYAKHLSGAGTEWRADQDDLSPGRILHLDHDGYQPLAEDVPA